MTLTVCFYCQSDSKLVSDLNVHSIDDESFSGKVKLQQESIVIAASIVVAGYKDLTCEAAQTLLHSKRYPDGK